MACGVPSIYLPHCVVWSFWSLPKCLAHQGAPDSSCICHASALEPAISLRSPGFLYWRMDTQTPRSECSVYSLLLGTVASRPSYFTEQGNIYVYNNPCVKHIVCIYFIYNFLYLYEATYEFIQTQLSFIFI